MPIEVPLHKVQDAPWQELDTQVGNGKGKNPKKAKSSSGQKKDLQESASWVSKSK